MELAPLPPLVATERLRGLQHPRPRPHHPVCAAHTSGELRAAAFVLVLHLGVSQES